MKLLSVLVLIFCTAITLHAATTDSSGTTYKRFAFGLNVGQPAHIAGANVIAPDQPFNTLHGDLNRFSIGAGAFVRYYAGKSFFMHARFMYSRFSYSLYDSIVEGPFTTVGVDWTNTIVRSYVTDNGSEVNNILVGIGGGHEARYGKFAVRAGGEIDFIKYSPVEVQTGSRMYYSVHSDSASGGTFTSNMFNGTMEKTTSPGLWAIGITGHATLEYKLTASFGIGASVYLGGFYGGTRNQSWKQHVEAKTYYYDSSNNATGNGYTYESELDYSARQFDFSPLNGQINFTYYFGRLL